MRSGLLCFPNCSLFSHLVGKMVQGGLICITKLCIRQCKIGLYIKNISYAHGEKRGCIVLHMWVGLYTKLCQLIIFWPLCLKVAELDTVDDSLDYSRDTCRSSLLTFRLM